MIQRAPTMCRWCTKLPTDRYTSGALLVSLWRPAKQEEWVLFLPVTKTWPNGRAASHTVGWQNFCHDKLEDVTPLCLIVSYSKWLIICNATVIVFDYHILGTTWGLNIGLIECAPLHETYSTNTTVTHRMIPKMWSILRCSCQQKNISGLQNPEWWCNWK